MLKAETMQWYVDLAEKEAIEENLDGDEEIKRLGEEFLHELEEVNGSLPLEDQENVLD